MPGARDRLIDSTIDLIATNGVAATGISELIAHSNVSRRTVYLNFPGGKSELVTDATKIAGKSMTDVLRHLVADAPVEEALGAFGAWWAHTLRTSGFTRGCPIAAAVLGRSEATDAAVVARETFENWVGVIRTRLEVDGLSHEEAASLGVTIVAAIEGAVLMCLAEQSTYPLDRVVRNMTRLVAIAGVP